MKKIIIFGIVVLIGGCIFGAVRLQGNASLIKAEIISSALADDEGSERSSSSSSSSSEGKVTTQTSTRVIIIKDRDGDGLIDTEDPHPDMAEIYIVKDENKNGIVDEFEKEKE